MKPTKFTEQYIFGKVIDFSIIWHRERLGFLSFIWQLFQKFEISKDFDILIEGYKANFYAK